MPFFDLQINGYAGVDFNDEDLTPEALHRACEALREDGVEGILATMITDTLPVLCKRLSRLAELRDADPLAQDLIAGVHLEGPFINQKRRYTGAHPANAVLQADRDDMKALLDASRRLIRLVTLAPERDPGAKLVRFLADEKILVAAGHCDCTRDELSAAIDNGLSLFTHFGNGCPAVLPRHDNILQRVLSLRDRLSFTLIGDGIHIPPFALKNYLDFIGIERAIVVTDATEAARMGPGSYRLGSQSIQVGQDRVARTSRGNHLMGSTATMPQMAAFLQREIMLDEFQIERLVYHHPRKLLGLPHHEGIHRHPLHSHLLRKAAT
jgi:N-acetylglucosamine-6-phosphate deacetylase